jgi:hypothetical protein
MRLAPLLTPPSQRTIAQQGGADVDQALHRRPPSYSCRSAGCVDAKTRIDSEARRDRFISRWPHRRHHTACRGELERSNVSLRISAPTPSAARQLGDSAIRSVASKSPVSGRVSAEVERERRDQVRRRSREKSTTGRRCTGRQLALKRGEGAQPTTARQDPY